MLTPREQAAQIVAERAWASVFKHEVYVYVRLTDVRALRAPTMDELTALVVAELSKPRRQASARTFSLRRGWRGYRSRKQAYGWAFIPFRQWAMHIGPEYLKRKENYERLVAEDPRWAENLCVAQWHPV